MNMDNQRHKNPIISTSPFENDAGSASIACVSCDELVCLLGFKNTFFLFFSFLFSYGDGLRIIWEELVYYNSKSAKVWLEGNCFGGNDISCDRRRNTEISSLPVVRFSPREDGNYRYSPHLLYPCKCILVLLPGLRYTLDVFFVCA